MGFGSINWITNHIQLIHYCGSLIYVRLAGEGGILDGVLHISDLLPKFTESVR